MYSSHRSSGRWQQLRWKVECYARNDQLDPNHPKWASWGEEDEYDLTDIYYDGKSLSFKRVNSNWVQSYSGTVSGRTIKGTFTQSGQQGEFSWSGTRSNVLTFGLT